jgi:hypothetical protein
MRFMGDGKSGRRLLASLYVLAVLGMIRAAAPLLGDPMRLWVQRGAVAVAIVVVILAFLEIYKARSTTRNPRA